MSSKPLRVSDQLFYEAEAAGDTLKRSAAKQVEFWAKLGKVAEQNLTSQQVDELFQGRTELVARPIEFKTVNFNFIRSRIEKEREAGTLSSTVIDSDEWYRLSSTPGHLEKVNRAGKVEIGKIIDGKFLTRDSL